MTMPMLSHKIYNKFIEINFSVGCMVWTRRDAEYSKTQSTPNDSNSSIDSATYILHSKELVLSREKKPCIAETF